MAGIFDLPRPFFALAPMDDVTDTVFRQIVAGCAPPNLFFTEFVNVDGLQSPGREKLLHKLRFSPKEKPLIAQLWGKNSENFYKTAKELVEMGYDGVDLNFGCPVRAVMKNGCGAAMINNRSLAAEIIAATREGLQHSRFPQLSDDRQKVGEGGRVDEPTRRAGDDDTKESFSPFPILSVKTRLGFSEIDFSWHKFLLKQKLNMLTIHGRTAKQMSKVPADWDAIGKIREMRDKLSPSTVIVGNGDVITKAQGEKLAKTYKLDGIMIGRGVFSDPFVFSKSSPWDKYTPKQKKALYAKHVKLFAKTWSNNERKVKTLNKFCKVYISDFDGAKELREKLMLANSTDELLKLLQ